MSNNVAPIDHSAGSAAASTTAGAAGGALMGAIKGGLGWIALMAIVGGYIGFTIASGGSLGVLSWPVFGALLGTVGGTGVGLMTYSTIAGLGALIGGVKGGARASRRVEQERTAAEIVRAQQIEQGPMMGQGYGYPAPGSRFNEAGSKVQLSGLQRDGVVSPENALQRA